MTGAIAAFEVESWDRLVITWAAPGGGSGGGGGGGAARVEHPANAAKKAIAAGAVNAFASLGRIIVHLGRNREAIQPIKPRGAAISDEKFAGEADGTRPYHRLIAMSARL